MKDKGKRSIEAVRSIIPVMLLFLAVFSSLSVSANGPSAEAGRRSFPFDLDGSGLDDRLEEGCVEFPVWTFIHTSDPTLTAGSVAASGAELGTEYTIVPVVSARFHGRNELERFMDRDAGASVEMQGEITLLQDVSVKAVKAGRSGEYTPRTAQDLGLTGAGTTIAVVDTGVDNEHSTFRDAFVAGADFTIPASPLTPRDGTFDPDDRSGHGTGVASVALGRGDQDGELKGVAPAAGLIDLKVATSLPFDPRGQNTLMDALQWCLDNRDRDWGDGYSGVNVLSISLGVGNGATAVAEAMDELSSEGIVVVQGSGNSGSSYSSGPGTTWADSSIVVGVIDDKGTVDRTDDEIWSSSTYGPRTDDGDTDPFDELRPDVVAPGVSITFASSSRTSLLQGASGWTQGSGSSYATPHVSGTAALMLEAKSQVSPRGTANPVRTIIHQTSEPKGEVYDEILSSSYNERYGFGMLDAYEACRAARGYTGANNRPEIRYFEVSPNVTTAGSRCTVRAIAVDVDEEPLEYELTVDDGTLTGDGPIWDWTAPGDPGRYYFNLKVTDGSGGTATAKTSVLVEEGVPNRRPVITSFRADKDVLLVGESTTLKVVAVDQDGDPLEYSYNARRGSVEGSGDEVLYRAPNTPVEDIVTVTVMDGKGGSDSRELEIDVREGSVNRPPSILLVTVEPNVITANTSGMDVKLYAQVMDPDGPGDLDVVLADLSSINGLTGVEMKDNGVYPDETAGDLEYSLLVEGTGGLENGIYPIQVTVYDMEGEFNSASKQLEVNITGSGQIEKGRSAGMDPVLLVVIITVILLIVIGAVIFLVMRSRAKRQQQPGEGNPQIRIDPYRQQYPPQGTFRPVQPR
ncbi:MAG: S8 family serine peptidase [Thermoplasmatota archaeon]